VPRVLEGGERNVFRIQRLKDKLGNRSSGAGLQPGRVRVTSGTAVRGASTCDMRSRGVRS
ncbi:hypothetical protein, partial [Streptomyces lavendulocolor]|uniref:hypothetical protein n=1 Tax=Streptomyces lavendulocolor TaxID=67316 RepID=UPI0033F3ED33